MRMVFGESPRSELGRIAESIRKTRDALPLAVLERARRRGELRPEVKPTRLFEVLRSACAQRLVRAGRLSEQFVRELVDLLMLGVLTPKARAPEHQTRRASARLVNQR